MHVELILFYIFSSLAFISALMVINLTNAVHSVLFLILVFCNVAGLLLLSGAEFLAFMLLIVYVGAIAVLFLFVVMMLNVKPSSFKIKNWSKVPLSLIIFSSLVFQLVSGLNVNFEFVNSDFLSSLHWNNWVLENNGLNNVEVIGRVLYTEFSFIFISSGFILLIAMVGAIVLTMHQKSNVKKQQIAIQLSRNFTGAVKFISLRK
uniref:NADH-ubiquinone oxidoreductase chain 6 n=1 Tax=Palmaria palmata TaxID=2822 RepID=A0A0A7A7V1_PALPL|nr:NADH dehydrogenase subunit 6 [Palmaria palmata]AHB62154.1 NADH dehydrogenase subunit 6 [Palmaria palmata]